MVWRGQFNDAIHTTMLPSNLTSALQAISRSGKPLIEAVGDVPNTVTKLEPGQQLQCSVQSRISEGLFNVQIAGQTVRMRLPANIQSGDAISLEVVSTNPRLTFSLPASTTPLSTPEQIGTAARLLFNLAELPFEQQVIRQISRHAIWQVPDQPPDSKHLAAALRDALANSGLFYESHQAQWVRGERSTAQLLIEPQNQLMGRRLAPPDASPAVQSDELYSLAPPSFPHVKPDGESNLSIAQELLPLLQQQLHALETRQVTWIGPSWPGQEMQWEIHEQPEHHAAQQDERQWSTEMELALPRLGDIHARLVFSGSELRLVLHAADPATAELFNRTLPKLKNSLADAGIQRVAAMVEKS